MSDWRHIKRLSSVKSNSGIKLLTPAGFPGSHCPMHTALALSAGIKGLSTLVVGTPECATYSKTVIPRPEGSSGELYWTYVLDANEVVFGCRDGLIEALETMDRAGARAILLIVTCVPELIGEDMEGLLYELQPRLSARLCFALLGHFKCSSHPPGYWRTLEALGSIMTSRETDPTCINVLGSTPGREQAQWPSLLSAVEAAGFRLRFLGYGTSLEDFLQAPDAALNLVVSPYADALAVHMEQDFGIPRIQLHNKYAASDIDDLYGDVAERLGTEWGDRFKAEREQAASLQEQAAGQLKGCRYVSMHLGDSMPVPMAVFLAGLGMEPLLLSMEEYYPDDRRWSKSLVSLGHDPWVCHMVNPVADVKLLESLEPDLCLGGPLGPGNKTPFVPRMFELHGMVGYERTSWLLTRILQAAGHAPEGGR